MSMLIPVRPSNVLNNPVLVERLVCALLLKFFCMIFAVRGYLLLVLLCLLAGLPMGRDIAFSANKSVAAVEGLIYLIYGGISLVIRKAVYFYCGLLDRCYYVVVKNTFFSYFSLIFSGEFTSLEICGSRFILVVLCELERGSNLRSIKAEL